MNNLFYMEIFAQNIMFSFGVYNIINTTRKYIIFSLCIDNKSNIRVMPIRRGNSTLCRKNSRIWREFIYFTRFISKLPSARSAKI